MDILFYSAALTGIGRRLLRMALSHVPRERIELCRSIAELEARLRQPLAGQGIAILHAADREALEALFSRRELLTDYRIILALPDNGEATTALAHALKPRFLIFSSDDLTDASVVLGKMLLTRHPPLEPSASRPA